MKRILDIFVLLCAFFISGCSKTIEGQGQVISQVRNLTAFQSINITGNFDIDIKNGPTRSVVITTNNNLQPYVNTFVKGYILIVKPKYFAKLIPTEQQKISITLPTFTKIVVSRANTVTAKNIDTTNFVASFKDVNNVELAGKATVLLLNSSGDSVINAKGLLAQDVSARVSGNSKVALTVAGNFTASISGGGSITYYGNPASLAKRLSGAGTVKKG